ncbi:MAG: hypothetical protein ACRETZ_08220 [Steroidobacteraceae bacterium]
MSITATLIEQTRELIHAASQGDLARRLDCRLDSPGIEQVNRAVMQMDALTQQNAALVEEATAAAQSMAGEARELSGTVGRYRISSHGRMSSIGAARAARDA